LGKQLMFDRLAQASPSSDSRCQVPDPTHTVTKNISINQHRGPVLRITKRFRSRHGNGQANIPNGSQPSKLASSEYAETNYHPAMPAL